MVLVTVHYDSVAPRENAWKKKKKKKKKKKINKASRYRSFNR